MKEEEEDNNSDMDVQSDSDDAPVAVKAIQKGNKMKKKDKVDSDSEEEEDSDDDSDTGNGKGSRYGGSVTGSQRGDYRCVHCILYCTPLYSTLLYFSSFNQRNKISCPAVEELMYQIHSS